MLLFPDMWKKATIPVSAGVFVLGLVMIIVSVVNGGSGGDSSPDSSSVGGVTVADEDVDTTEVLDFSGFVTSTAVAQVSSGQSSTSGGQSNAGSSGMPPVSPTTIAPPSGTPTTFAFSGIPAPSNPGLPGLGLPSRDSYAPPTTPAAGGGFIVVVSSCSSFQECAQKLYEQWINGEHCFFDDLDSAFATQAVYDTMRAYCGNTSGQWNPLTQGAGRYQLAGVSNRTSSPKVIVFNMVPGQTDPIVRSVQIQ
jgi:hypothetical protein